MPTYLTPGVYYERVDSSAPAISAIRTDVAGFVGIARRGPLHQAVPVQSWRQFVAWFGDFTGAGYLAYAVRAFFENGGRRCWVVRVASDAAAAAEVVLHDAGGAPRWVVQAFSPGVWGNDVTLRLSETHRAQTVTLPGQHAPDASTVASVTGFGRVTHVRLRQPGAPDQTRVLNDVDVPGSRLLWRAAQPEAALPYDAPLAGFDLSRPVVIESIEYTLMVFELGRLVRVYEGLTLVPEHPRHGPVLLEPLRVPDETTLLRISNERPRSISEEGVAGRVLDETRLEPGLLAAPEPLALLLHPDAPPFAGAPLDVPPLPLPLAGGADGLALLAEGDFVGEPISPYDSDSVRLRKTRGLRALESVREVALVAVPDIHIQPVAEPATAPLPLCIPDPCLPPPPLTAAPAPRRAVGDLPPRFGQDAIHRVQAALVLHCEQQRDRIALLDTPFAAAQGGALFLQAAHTWRRRFDSTYAAFYYPWLQVVDPLRSAPTRPIPPSGHVAGQCAATDLRVGVHKAPANAPLVWAQDVTAVVDEPTHGVFNQDGINVLRVTPGRGLRILGARTVSSDPAWRYVNVRRLLLMIEKAVDLATQWAVFEPNTHVTRAKITLALTSFLIALWQRGALMGATADAAFFVRCDETNNPPAARDRGLLLAEVGVAPSIPFEFVVLRVERSANAFEIAEGTRGGIGGY